ncbi:hypothetical protein B0H13DRAFT_1700663, partial [Mycena leptocephala]
RRCLSRWPIVSGTRHHQTNDRANQSAGIPSSGRSRSLSEIKVHERSKKAVTQQITLGEPEVLAKHKTRVNSQPAGPDLVKFSFKYRPADVLRANGIIPSLPQLKRKASAELQSAQTPDADGQEEKILRERLKALEAKRIKQEKKPRVKNEADAVVDLTQDRKKKVKLERKESFIQGEIIDLT